MNETSAPVKNAKIAIKEVEYDCSVTIIGIAEDELYEDKCLCTNREAREIDCFLSGFVSSENNDSELAEGENGEEERVEGLAKMLRIGIELPNHFTTRALSKAAGVKKLF